MTIRDKAMAKDVITSAVIGILAAAATDCFGSPLEFATMAASFAWVAAIPVIGYDQIFEICDKRKRANDRREYGR